MSPNSQKSSVDEKMAILIKAYELEPLPKLSLLIGERAVKELLHSGQYLGSLLQSKNLYWIIGEDRDVKLLDERTAKIIRDHPVTGYSHYISDHGAANVFGRQVFEGKMPLEPAIGAASAIGLVEQDPDGHTRVMKKQQMGIEPQSIRQVADKFHRVEPETPSLIKRRGKQQYEHVYEEAKKAKEEREQQEDTEETQEAQILEDADTPFFLTSEDDSLELVEDETPELVGDQEIQPAREEENDVLVPDTQMYPSKEQEDDDDDEDVSLPF